MVKVMRVVELSEVMGMDLVELSERMKEGIGGVE